MNEDLQRILKPRTLAADWSRSCWTQADEVLNQQSPGQTGPDNLIRDLSFYHDLRESVSKGFDSAYKTGAFTVLAPVGLFGLVEGFAAPDWDISTLGIGYHRYFFVSQRPWTCCAAPFLPAVAGAYAEAAAGLVREDKTESGWNHVRSRSCRSRHPSSRRCFPAKEYSVSIFRLFARRHAG